MSSSKSPRSITPANTGFFKDVLVRLKLILRLMADSRVSPFLKIIPVATLVYVIWPIDIPGPFDDAAVVWLGNSIFVELCPPGVVQEHLDALRQTPQVDWTSADGVKHAENDVVDAEFRETTGVSQDRK